MILSLCALLSLAACDGASLPEDSKNALPSVDELQTLAIQECQCRLAGLESETLIEEFRIETQDLQGEGYGTSSYPVSYEGVCYPELGQQSCISTGASLIGNSDAFACTIEQGMELERVWNEAMTDPYGPSEDADAAVIVRREELITELRSSIEPVSCR